MGYKRTILNNKKTIVFQGFLKEKNIIYIF